MWLLMRILYGQRRRTADPLPVAPSVTTLSFHRQLFRDHAELHAERTRLQAQSLPPTPTKTENRHTPQS